MDIEQTSNTGEAGAKDRAQNAPQAAGLVGNSVRALVDQQRLSGQGWLWLEPTHCPGHYPDRSIDLFGSCAPAHRKADRAHCPIQRHLHGLQYR